MDYAVAGNNNDKRIDGEHQFNTETNKGNVCGHLDGLLQQTGGCEFFAAYAPVCGDSVLTPDTEECECAGGLTRCTGCRDCKYVEINAKMAVCSPQDVDPFTSRCCDASGQFSAFGAACQTQSGADGYCGAGTCNQHHTDCPRVVLTEQISGTAFETTDDVCDDWVPGSDDCRMGCKWPANYPRPDDICADISERYSGGTGHEPDGNVCRVGDGTYSTCKDGSCQGALTTTTPPPTAPPDYCTDAATSGYGA